MTDHTAKLSDFTDEELLAEIQRRRAEAQRRLDRFAVAAGDKPKYAAKSEAKAIYWAEWRQYKANHPNATVEQWQRMRKRGK